MSLNDITKELNQFQGLLTKFQDFDFVSDLVGSSDLSKDDKEKLMRVKRDENFLSLIKKKASKEEIEAYIKTVK